ncbi:MAG TPA: ABC transporter permease [Chryseolinea sp.]|nr:ABC transporter permease [Chryseolinea sp.]
MIKNYLLITLRNFARNRSYTLINILGLSIGISSCLIIFLVVSNDLSFDKFHSHYDRIYRVVIEGKTASGTDYGSTTPYPFTKAFRNDFPNVPMIAQLHMQEDVLMKVGVEKRRMHNVLFADSLFFDAFDFKVLSGNPKVDLAEPGKVFLTKTLADNLTIDGKMATTIKLDNKLELEVAGIIADPPPNSHISFSMLVSMPSLSKDFMGFPVDSWGTTIAGYNYLVLPENLSPEKLEDDLKKFVAKYYSPEDAARKTFKLQPLREIHFDQQYTENPGDASNANMNDLVVMGVLGVFILSIACVNFINLATALAIKKSKEIGIRKTLGARRSQLTLYFLSETFLLTVVSVVISLGAVEWLLRWLNSFLQLSLELNLTSDPWLASFIILIVFFTTALAGFYPAIVLSGFNPLAVLKNKITAQGTSGASVRKVLVVFQFIIAQVLIMGTLIIAGQMEYFRQKPLGFDTDAIVNVPLPDNAGVKLNSLKTRLESNAAIRSVSLSLGAPISGNNFTTGHFLSDKGPQERHTVQVKPVDLSYLETYGLSMVAGRWFTATEQNAILQAEDPWKANFNYIINEAGARRLGFANPADIVGKKITTGINDINAEVIGVVGDFHTTSLHEAIEPVIMILLPQFFYDAGIKVNTKDLSSTIAFIERNWLEVYPEYDFEYQVLDDSIARLYEHDARTFTLFKVFASISIFIGCLGLYGLISFMASQKLKEVGIRKVMGASVASIMILFSKEFVKLIIIAFCIAAPLAYYFMNQWLEGFAYRISIPWTVYVVGVVSTLVIAILTVSYRSAEAARTNPADTLRSE